jgi:predicted dehydrogenase
MENSNRRQFLQSSAAMLAGGPAIAAKRAGANDRIRVCIAGLRGRGNDHIKILGELEKENIELAAFCDVDRVLMEQRASDYQKLTGKKVQLFSDMRKVLDDKSFDAVTLATPNHWHALGVLWACQAGKDVYVEKPGTQTFKEGKIIIDAAKKYNCIVQHGTQNRTSPNIVEGIRKLKEGVIGKVYLARGIDYKVRRDYGKIQTGPVPDGLDWDQWQGPAPNRPYSKFTHTFWHSLWDFGAGEMGNQGVHEFDLIRWALDLDTHPSRISGVGGHYINKDDGQTPQVVNATFEWPGRDVLVEFEVRTGFTNTEAGIGAEYPFVDKKNVVGVVFIGTAGYMIFPDYTSYRVFLGAKRQEGPSQAGPGDTTVPHFQNFFAAMRSRKPGDLAAGPEELHHSSALPHFANISIRTGRELHFDSKTEKFTGNEDANRLLARTYRAPYVLPRKV